jgi:hypothetical protein
MNEGNIIAMIEMKTVFKKLIFSMPILDPRIKIKGTKIATICKYAGEIEQTSDQVFLDFIESFLSVSTFFISG